MYAQSTYVSSSLAAHPENTHLFLFVKLNKLALVDGSNSEITLDGSNDWRSLEQSSTQSLQSLGNLFLVLDWTVESDNANVLFAGGLLGFDETGGLLNADDQAAGYLGVKSTRVASFLDTEDALDPGDNFV